VNHSAGKLVETYDRYDFLDEMKAALEKWARKVNSLKTNASEDRKVLELRRA